MFRRTKTIEAVIAQDAAVSTVHDIGGYAAGILCMPDSWTEAHIGFKIGTSVDPEGTFLPLYNAAGTLVEVHDPPVADSAYVIPAEVFQARFIQIWSEASGEDLAQEDSDKTIVLMLQT